MQQHSLFRIEALLATVLVVNVLGFALDASTFIAIAFVWAFYVLVFAILGVRQKGFRGLGWPSLAYAATATLHPPVASMVVGMWLICTLTCLPIIFMNRQRKQPSSSQANRPLKEFEPVSVAVPPATGAGLLDRLGQ
jgi:hypothetical protein